MCHFMWLSWYQEDSLTPTAAAVAAVPGWRLEEYLELGVADLTVAQAQAAPGNLDHLGKFGFAVFLR